MTTTRRIGTTHVRTLSFGRIARDLVDLLALWRDRAGQRRALAKLDERILRDIGVGRAEADEEAGKPFWRP